MKPHLVEVVEKPEEEAKRKPVEEAKVPEVPQKVLIDTSAKKAPERQMSFNPA